VVVVHYAGVACEMDRIQEICKSRNLVLVEDAAHALGGSYKGKPLGSIGAVNAFSFHETKNLSNGEGGAFSTPSPELFARAEIIREKGTNRSQFFRGQVDKYRWVDLGSSFLPSEFQSAVLWSQLEKYDEIQGKRMHVFELYDQLLSELEMKEYLRRPIIPAEAKHPAHLYYILLQDLDERTRLMSYLKEQGISSFFHYVPLHSAPAGRKFTREGSSLNNTDRLSESLLRLPLWAGLSDEQIYYVVEKINKFFAAEGKKSNAAVKAAIN
ncbi:MAG: DegT/DnrJ/EryC1/StrS family aminotransferase, partial [Candidatus Obscuribacterales bacterium]|nr:DegT/DnrJ/EryC1/StrS family aminotransferase [Candidatus Obscuribacterales bacterium]